MMSLNFNKSSCFSAIIDPSDPYENYPDKKKRIEKRYFGCCLKPVCQCMDCKMTIGLVITV